MKCAACGYSDVQCYVLNNKRAGLILEGQKKPFIEVSLVKYFPGKAEPNCIIEWPDLIKAFACPVCGTIKMEV